MWVLILRQIKLPKLVQKVPPKSLQTLHQLFVLLSCFFKQWKMILTCKPREGVIIKCPLNGQYHDHRDVILKSQMAVSNNFIMVTVIQNIGNSSFYLVNPSNIVSFKKFRYLLLEITVMRRRTVSKIYLTGRSRLRCDR